MVACKAENKEDVTTQVGGLLQDSFGKSLKKMTKNISDLWGIKLCI